MIAGDAPTHLPLCPPCKGPTEEEASEDSGASEEGYQRSAELEGDAGPYGRRSRDERQLCLELRTALEARFVHIVC